MSHYKPYPAYKDSGVEWLGRVPEHWYVVRMRYAATLNPPVRRDLLDDPDQEVSFLPMEAIGEDGSLNLEQNRPVADVRNGYSYFEDGDVAFAKVTPCFENGKGALMRGLRCAAGFGTTELTVLRPNLAVADARYINYIVQGSSFRAFGAGAMTGAGGLKRVPDEFTRNFPVLLPELGEQRVIASTLDRETARIDALIEKKTRFIELLREKRQALITHAVTKGLDPNAKMKDSGVEWLGEVPEHWGVRSFKHLAGIRYGIGEPPAYKAEGTPLIRATNVDAGCIRSEGLVYVDPADIPDKRIIWLAPGDIIVVRSGAYTGDSAIVQEHHCPAIAGFDMVVSPKCVNPFFLQYALLSRYLKSNQIDLEKMRAAQPHLNAEELGSCFVLLPPPIEQESIVAFLDHSTKRVDGVISKTLLSIDLLKERRSALITAAVNGQIDLRETV